jgi:hypothetical protein
MQRVGFVRSSGAPAIAGLGLGEASALEMLEGASACVR